MYVELGQALQAEIDCAGDIGPDQGAVFGRVRHPAGQTPLLHVEKSGGARVSTILLALHPRTDIHAPRGTAVSGFTLIHDIPPGAAGRLLVVGAGGAEVALDLLAYGPPAEPKAATLGRDPGANFQFLQAAARDPARIRALSAGDVPLGLFGGWLDRLPRYTGAPGHFLAFRRLSIACTGEGEVAISGEFGVPGEASEATACALVRLRDAPPMVAPLAQESSAPLGTGFALYGQLALPPCATVELVVQLRRGDQAWWFRAEAEAVALPAFLRTLTLEGIDLPGSDAGVLHGWVREVLRDRSDRLRGRLSGLGLPLAGHRDPGFGGRTEPAGGTALLFGLHDDYAARLLALLAPQMEAQFGRIVISGAAAGRAAAALLRRGRVEVLVEEDAEGAMAAASAGAASVTPIDTPALVDIAIEGSMARLARHTLPADRLPILSSLHEAAGTGGMKATLRGVVAILSGADPDALPLPGQRPDAMGGLVAEHLRGVWDMVAGTEPRR
jgi:hypothetical protein